MAPAWTGSTSALRPTQLAATADGRLVVVSRSGSISVVDMASLSEVRRIELADAPFPHGVALSSDGHTAFVSFEGTVESLGGALAVDIDSGRVRWRMRAGAYTLGIAMLRPPDLRR